MSLILVWCSLNAVWWFHALKKCSVSQCVCETGVCLRDVINTEWYIWAFALNFLLVLFVLESDCTVKLLDDTDVYEERHSKWGIDWLREKIFILSRKWKAKKKKIMMTNRNNCLPQPCPNKAKHTTHKQADSPREKRLSTFPSKVLSCENEW